ncbi:hypothetical protein GCM10009840_32140 [Pseudolysinimonas kribbensis]|uniref:Uncharacterized protein n=1 Tax=Pseudolysinimonas kribbensis TaxID=433641 RepID=A0ABQ6KAF1_9MICO|nr:hypothetical protein GCM10025881_27290 [Pseudolysinimonas kribbensis]
MVHDAQAAAAVAASAAKHKRELAEQKAADQKAKDDAERESRKESVTEIENSVKEMAQKDVTEGVLDGPIISATCDPVSGSTDDLTDQTTTFNCFVANKDNGDGTFSGYYFNATMNWSSGSYTYGLGKAG